jgi:hypothetical protein
MVCGIVRGRRPGADRILFGDANLGYIGAGDARSFTPNDALYRGLLAKRCRKATG